MKTLADAYRGKRVLLTGHTGFKGGWLALWLHELGARTTGFSLAPSTHPNLFEAARVASVVDHVEGDVRDPAALARVWAACRPEIVFHLAAQPLVRASYLDPLTTVQTNVLGVVHILEEARRASGPTTVVVATSDKCYENREWVFGYRETDPMGGHDVYSASKGAAEILVASWRRSFFADASQAAVATVRAGNVIGGGDWAPDRIVPDCIRALTANQSVAIRNPRAIRPWQHVLEPLGGYLMLGARLAGSAGKERAEWADAWNFGPNPDNARPASDLADAVATAWGVGDWRDASDPAAPHEAAILRLCIDKAGDRLGWRPRWDFAATIHHTVAWYQGFHRGDDMAGWCRRQIADYIGPSS